jgi:hypothetical protein
MANRTITIKKARQKLIGQIRGKTLEGILTGIARPESKDEIYKRFKNLSVNEQALPQGDGTIRISPFDDYVLFTIYDEKDGHDTPMDLSNVGSLFLSFIGETDEIRIPYYTNVQDLDLSAGQVLFRISESDSKKILALDNKNFYVSCQMISEDGTPSDQSILYQGTFLSFTEDSVATMQSKYDDLAEKSTAEIILLQEERMGLEVDLGMSKEEGNRLWALVNNLRGEIKKLTSTIDDLNKEVNSAQAAAAAAAATQAASQQNLEQLLASSRDSAGGNLLSGIGTAIPPEVQAQIKAQAQYNI